MYNKVCNDLAIVQYSKVQWKCILYAHTHTHARTHTMHINQICF